MFGSLQSEKREKQLDKIVKNYPYPQNPTRGNCNGAAHRKLLWIVEDNRNKCERMILDQFYGVCDLAEWKIGQILAKIVKKLAETPKILLETTQMDHLHPQPLNSCK